MVLDTWNPTQYERFAAERRQPFEDLCALLEPAPEMRVVDLGCGTGELTAALHARTGARSTLGIDRSTQMLSRSAAFVGSGLRFEQRDIGTFSDAGGFDLVFSNAALQWVPGHVEVFPRLAGAVAQGGQIAVQVPANFDHPAHRTAAALAAEEPFASAMASPPATPAVLAPEQYAILLDELGFARQHVRLQVYAHHLPRRDDVVEWVRGTTLTGYEAALSSELFALFLERYRARLMPQLRDTTPFFYPFKRILMWARRADG
jgi:trans-aconitate 2-methyltransferase